MVEESKTTELDNFSYERTNGEKYDHNWRKNHEGYDDPTAATAVKNYTNSADYERFHKFLGLIFRICEMADFEIVGRLTIIDKRTGRTWR